MSLFKNSKKDSFLKSIPVCSLHSDDDFLTKRSKFNFSYFEKQEAGQSFDEWDHDKLQKLFKKLKDYSNQPLSYWMNQTIGKSGTVLSIYGAFPSKSDFSFPKHIPHQVLWGRFRLEWADRLIGFVVPNECHGKVHQVTGEKFDCNTFYVVFLDSDHRFYKSERK